VTLFGDTPPIPDTGWRLPTEFPDLSGAKQIAVDVETCDPDLKTKGPGVRRGGYLVGLAVGTDDGYRAYFPIAHDRGENLPEEQVLGWAQRELGRADQPKVGANLMYDLDYLAHAGVPVAGAYLDVQNAEPILDEHRKSYALDALAKDYLGEGKVGDELYGWCAEAFGGVPTAKAQGGNIWRAPASIVGPYAEGDVDLPLRILPLQFEKLKAEGLTGIWDLETRLVPMLLHMRRTGVRVDVPKAESLRVQFLEREAKAQRSLNEAAGGVVDVWSNASIAHLFDRRGLDYPRTAKGNPSFKGDWLEYQQTPEGKMIHEVRRLSKVRGTFVENAVLGHQVNGRIHALFHQLRRDEGGTVSGRFSCASPNLQQLSARDQELAPLIRGLFLPEEGEDWVALDYSQVEYRLMVHAAQGPGAEEARQRYRDDPTTDYHKMTQAMLSELLGREVSRKATKNINFGKIFSMGKEQLINQLPGLSRGEAEAFFDAYEAAVPYAKTTAERASQRAEARGYIRTILGRHARFPFWEAADWELSRAMAYCKDRKEMQQRVIDRAGEIRAGLVKYHSKYRNSPVGGVRRAKTHKALNAYTQGSGADIMKKGMVDAWEAGIFAPGLLTPLVTVHDELGISKPRTLIGEEALMELKHIMETCVQLKVPLLVDMKRGASWGACE